MGGKEEMRLTFHETIKMVEPAAGRPGMARRRWRAFNRRRVVPFAYRSSSVTGRLECFGKRRSIKRELP